MFTPPPSPQPSKTDGFNAPMPPTDLHSPEIFCDHRFSDDTKRHTGRRFLWAVVLAPFIVIAFTVYGGYPISLVRKSAPVVFSHSSSYGLSSHQSGWKREPKPQAVASTSTTSSSSPVASQILPTIPTSPLALPTPFPQAFDGIITQNFSSSSCLNFFDNMTASMDFRSCRAFSFLSSTSTTFINAQTNLTLMNSLIWGTCNTTLSNSQCQSNMASFASQLQSDCSQELAKQNVLVVNSLTALQAFQVMHDAACLADPTTNAYCYLSAVQNPNPSDLYFYSLPLGIPLPTTATPTCSACSKSLMGIYATALQDPSQAKLLTGLKSAYEVSVQIAAQFCGSTFALTSISDAISLYRGWPTIFTSSVFALTWTIFNLVS